MATEIPITVVATANYTFMLRNLNNLRNDIFLTQEFSICIEYRSSPGIDIASCTGKRGIGICTQLLDFDRDFVRHGIGRVSGMLYKLKVFGFRGFGINAAVVWLIRRHLYKMKNEVSNAYAFRHFV